MAGAHIAWLYFLDNSETIPAEGGTYTEGVLGSDINFINPLFAQPNTLEADITNLVYSGLTKYDATTGKIVPDLATFTLDKSKKKYFFTIRDNAKWHDGNPVTIDDVLFTYKDILQNPDFKNPVLHATFQDVIIEKIDEKTIGFTLKEPYYFFPSATTVGILPKHLWSGLPLSNLDKSELNLTPIGSGPYKFLRVKKDDTSNIKTIDLGGFPDYYGTRPKLSGITFIVYPDFSSLLSHLSSLDAVNNISLEYLDTFKEGKRFQIFSYTLPQYVAIFLNTASKKLEDKKVRLGLLLGTNKDILLRDITDVKRIDTPLFELKNASWIYQADEDKAKGALFDAGWKLPSNNSNINQSISSIHPAYFAATTQPATSYKITDPNHGTSFTTNQTYFIIRGTNPTDSIAIVVNNYTLKKFSPSKGTWSYVASTELGTLKRGKNVYNVFYINANGKKVSLDSISITYDPLFGHKPVTNENGNMSATMNVNTNSVSPSQINDNLNIPSNTNAPGNSNTTSPEEHNTNSDNANQMQQTLIPDEWKDNIRYNSNGEPLVLKLITTETPADFSLIAKQLQQEWLKIGVYLDIEILPIENLLSRINSKSYDIILYGQNLGYNLDIFPYWHSSQGGEAGLNLSNFKSFQADALIEEIRNPYLNKNIDTQNNEQVEKSRQDNLKKLGAIFEDTIPAIFMYQPIYFYAVDNKKIYNVEIKNLSYFSDRFALIQNWYKQEKRVMRQDPSWAQFQQWFIHTLQQTP